MKRRADARKRRELFGKKTRADAGKRKWSRGKFQIFMKVYEIIRRNEVAKNYQSEIIKI
jgi:hypothetical protein